MVTKRENLRTVSYKLGTAPFEFHPDEVAADTSTVENDKEVEEREGLFHTWAEVLAWDAQAGQYYVDRVALIEDLNTGNLHEVKHQDFHFTDVINELSQML